MDWVNQFLHPCSCDVHTRGLARISRQMRSASGPRPPGPAVASVNTVTRPIRLEQPHHVEHPAWVRLGRVHPSIHEQPFTPPVRDRPGPFMGWLSPVFVTTLDSSRTTGSGPATI